LGSVRDVTDASGNVRARYSYDPYGRQTMTSGNMTSDFGFAGMFWSPEANLALIHYRAYDPTLARWLSRDPLNQAELGQGPNLYAYVHNNPVNHFDSIGLLPGEQVVEKVVLGVTVYTVVREIIPVWNSVQAACVQNPALCLQAGLGLAGAGAGGAGAVGGGGLGSPAAQQCLQELADEPPVLQSEAQVVAQAVQNETPGVANSTVASIPPAGLNTQVQQAMLPYADTILTDPALQDTIIDNAITEEFQENQEWAFLYTKFSFAARPDPPPNLPADQWIERTEEMLRILEQATGIRGREFP
jgi:RHS repeat-associated protein